jgi:hypothetical protein
MYILRKNNRIEIFQSPNINLVNNYQKNHNLISNSGISFRRNDTNISNNSLILTNLVLNLDAGNTYSYSGPGNTWYDTSGYNNNFIINTGTYISTPIVCFQNGVFSQTTGNFLGNDMTIQSWINTTSNGNGNSHWMQMQIMSAETPGSASDFGFGVNQNGQLQWGNGPSDGSITSTNVVNTGNWINVAVTRNKATGNINLYINGVNINSGTLDSGNSLTSNNNLIIGSGTDGGKNWIGYMNNILAYTSVLTDSDILSNYNNQKTIYGY